MKLKIFFISLFISVSLLGKSQADSLLRELVLAKNPKTKITIYNKLFLEYEFENSTLAKSYLKKALSLAKQYALKKEIADTYNYFGFLAEDQDNYPLALKYYKMGLTIRKELNDLKGIGAFYNNIAIIYNAQGNYKESIENHLASLEVENKLNNQEGIAASLNNIGNVFANQGNNGQALKYYFKCLQKMESMNNIEGLATSYNNIGEIHYSMKDYEKAISSHLQALKIRKKLKDENGIASSFKNLGNVYSALGNYSKSLEFHFASLEIENKYQDKNGIARSYSNIGSVLTDQADKMENTYLKKLKLNDALKYQLSAIKLKEEIGDKAGLAASYNNLGATYFSQNNYSLSRIAYTKAREIGLNIGHKDWLTISYFELSKLDSIHHNMRAAIENYKLYRIYKDSVNSEETQKLAIQTQMTFEFEKKEAIAKVANKKELENHKKVEDEKARKQNIIIFFSIIGLLFLFAFSIYIIISLKKSRKQNKIIAKQKEIVEHQRNEVEHQKELVEEKQKEVMDSIRYARRIQFAQLPSLLYINKNLNKLNKTK